ncbi:MAG TPA: GH25 family lysozyme [Verrucomicrobiae bacterium]|nr:GH25 family lysozyme [Verrucomicrobiae bacterium]
MSTHQGEITTDEWATFHRPTNQAVNSILGDGRDFAFIRASRGGTTGEDHRSGGYPAGDRTLTNLSQRYDDPYFVQNITRATAAGLIAGPYHYGRADVVATTGNSGGIANTGRDEANHMIEMAGAWMRPGYLLPVFDLEAGQSERTSAELTAFAIEFSDRIYEVMGIRPTVYCGGNYTTYVQASIVNAFPNLWIARWPNQTDPASIPVQTMNPNDSISYIYGPWDDPPRPAQPWAFWQYASTARLNGNPGANLDVDVAHGGIEYVKDYCVPALWITNSDGLWTTLSNWNSGVPPVPPVQGPGQLPRVGPLTLPTARLPGSEDTVILDRPNTNITITLGSGTHTIRKLYVREALNITNGTLTINYVPSTDSTPLTAQFSAPVMLSGTGNLRFHTLQVDATRTFTLGGGTLTFNTITLMPQAVSPAKLAVIGNVIINPLIGATATIGRGAGTGAAGFIDLGGGLRNFTIGNGTGEVDFSCDVALTNGGVTKLGGGTMRLGAASTYNGGTIVSAGKLLVDNATGSATGIGSVTVNGGTLAGTGTILGPVSILPTGTVAPGIFMGGLTISNSLTLAGTALMELNAASRTSDQVRGLTTVTYGGTLNASNVTGTLSTSNTFKLFSANSYEGAFATITPAEPGPGLGWNTNTLAIDGTLRVLSTAQVTVIASRSGSGGPLTLAWPADHIGWRLQFQTNAPSIGITTNWVDVPSSTLTNRVILPADPTVGSAFYRLVFP